MSSTSTFTTTTAVPANHPLHHHHHHQHIVKSLAPPISPIVAKMKEHFLSLDIPMQVNAKAGTFTGFDLKPFSTGTTAGEPEVTCWLLDTRDLWHGDNIFSAEGAAQALSLISLPEQNSCTTKMFVSDARMSLASALLKRLFITKTLGIPWKDVKLARKGNEKHGKPCAVDESGRPIDGIDFNVSHQNGLVALIGWDGRKQHRYDPNGHIQGLLSPGMKQDDVMVGVDIVCVNERDSAHTTIDMEGFDGWVDIYDSVFSEEERWSMKYDVDRVTLLDGSQLKAADLGRHDRCITRHKDISLTTPAGQDLTFSSELLIDAKLRRFYTYFCYKEAYIKLAGEALLAPWLRQLEFSNVRSPRPGTQARCSTHGTWGEEVDDVEVRLHGRPVDDVRMKIQAFEENFMLSTAIQGAVEGLKIPAFQKLDLQADVMAFAGDHLSEPSVPTIKGPPGPVRNDSMMNMHGMPEVNQCPEALLSPWESRYF
ncbi:putative phosphopantetheinyl transferase [Hortaea werneckii]|nr:putative phosphopantetheinyl transferase [Hortaea werneckii]